MPNAIDLLKADHTHVKALFQQYDAVGHRAYQKKQGIVEEVFAALDVHATREEELFYQAMKRKTDQDGKDLLAEAIEEHHVVTTLMDELKGLDPKVGCHGRSQEERGWRSHNPRVGSAHA